MKERLRQLIEARNADYEANFSHVEHEIAFDAPPPAELHLHFVRSDASGEPRVRELARVLARYITLYCFKAERRRNLRELDRNELYMQARDLFRKTSGSGQLGELLIYFLLETVLHAPQVLKKMPMTTNPKDERKGSDGVHLRWDEKADVLELIFAESKIWKSFSDALDDAFESMESFHTGRTKRHEVNVVTSTFSELDPQLQGRIASYIDGKNASQYRETHACLIGFNWSEYGCLKDKRRANFIAEFEQRYRAWAISKRKLINDKVKAFKHKSLRLEFFMIPFQDVEAFRTWFIEELTGIE